MKKLLLIFTVFVLMFSLSPAIMAQEASFGVKGGLSLANVTGDEVEDVEWKMGGAGGLFVEYKVSDVFAIHPEVLYCMKGSKSEGEIFETTIESTLKLTYIDIPVLAKVMIPVEGSVSPSLFAGPYVGFNLDAKLELEAEGESDEGDIKDYVKSTDYGLVVGGGLDYHLDNGGAITLDARYSLGLSGIYDEEGEDEEGSEVKNQAVMVMIGYAF